MGKIKIHVQMAGLIDGDSVHGEKTVQIKDGGSIQDVIAAGDKVFGFKKKYFKLLTRQGLTPTILLNHDRVDLPEGYDQKLKDGDHLSVILPLAGGRSKFPRSC